MSKRENERKHLVEEGIYTEVSAMHRFLEENLHAIMWPRETIVSSEILGSGEQLFVDVDLPEIEAMPNKKASSPQRGYTLSVKELSSLQVQRLYMCHVHGIGFRIIGEAFATLPTVQEVVLSAFSQRPDRATGRVGNEYLYSVRVQRNDWRKINFKNLKELDVVEALAQFELRRDMTKNGNFKAITPFEPDNAPLA